MNKLTKSMLHVITIPLSSEEQLHLEEC